MFIYSLYSISFLGIFYFLLRRNSGRILAILFTFLIAINVRFLTHSTISYTNLPFAIYLSLGFIYSYFYIKERESKDLILSGLMFGLSAFTRSEESLWLIGIASFSVIYFMQIFLKMEKFKSIFVVFIINILLFVIPWELFKNYLGIDRYQSVNLAGSYLNSLLSRFNLTTFRESILYFWRGTLRQDILLVVVFIASLMFKRNFIKVEVLFQVISVILLYTFLYLGVLAFGLHYNNYHWWSLIGSFERMTMFMAPIFIFFSAENISSQLKRMKVKRENS